MTGTYTSRGNLYKSAADGNDFVNVVQDLSNNMDKLDALLGWRPVTAGTVPASAFQGAPFYFTDTGKAYINTGVGGSAALTQTQVLVAGASFDSLLNVAATASATGGFNARVATTGNSVLTGSVALDTTNRFIIFGSGIHEWGPGNAARDTNLYRSAAEELTTDGSLLISGDLTVGVDTSLENLNVSGNAVINGATRRPQLHTVTTVANTVTETALQTVNIPAADAVVGSTYRIRAFGSASVTGTPTIQFRARLGTATGGDLIAALGGITVRSGMTNGYWEIEIMLTCTASPGASATWYGFAKLTHNFLTGVGTYTPVGPINGTFTRSSLASTDLHLTAQWGTASASNTITAQGSESGRVA